MERDLKLGGRYRLIDPLGAGGMSVVWRAEDEVLGREVAVKVMSAELAADPTLLTQLHAEARAAAGLRHVNVVEVYDYGESLVGGVPVPYVVMELVAGRSLKDLLSAGPLPWPVAVLIGAQVAAALAAAHGRGVVHRDVKPANVMVTATGVKLVDFGISAAVGEPDSVLGTPAYLAPERLAGGLVRPATDVYALGLLLYLMLAGELPWRASTTTEMLVAHRYHDPADLPSVAGLPARVASLCAGCLGKEPADRPSAADAARVLAQAAGLPAMSPLPTGADDDVDDDLATTRVAAGRGAGGSGAGGNGAGGSGAGGHRAAGTGFGRRLAVAALALAVPAATTGAWWWNDRAERTPATAALGAPISCSVRYHLRDVSAGRTSATLTLVNDGAVPLDRWRLSFRLPGDQKLLRGSNATWHQDGDVVRADGTKLVPGKALTTTIEASYGEATALPDEFTLNAVACRSDLSFQGRTAEGTAEPVAKVKPADPPAKKAKPAAVKPKPKPAKPA
ncbi:serine/threonine-protein kinase [Paractinoplanes rishiriensis]|uniref:serine/threonine-protein kinase n=1 Tax=Paractinoplanes rishiriensis TaxID=1050105 RepID=UPI0023B279C3|nr:serine/threonine-protein kinase [Actinoplanes rishiriensis]